MRKAFLSSITIFFFMTLSNCNKDDNKGSITLSQHQLDSLAILADTIYIRNEVFDTSHTTIINSKKVYLYSCDMYFPKQLGAIQGSVANGAIFEYKTSSMNYYYGNSIFYSKTMDYVTGKTYVQVGVDTFGFKYHWHFYNSNNFINTLDRSFKL